MHGYAVAMWDNCVSPQQSYRYGGSIAVFDAFHGSYT
ncbi:hypothetical protein SPHINGOT1_10262 [Sphingomonas sp. T1]|nr:hypothetical protein SPHINGOT1_10262 [Sphingomonas sp. T1]